MRFQRIRAVFSHNGGLCIDWIDKYYKPFKEVIYDA